MPRKKIFDSVRGLTTLVNGRVVQGGHEDVRKNFSIGITLKKQYSIRIKMALTVLILFYFIYIKHKLNYYVLLHDLIIYLSFLTYIYFCDFFIDLLIIN